MKKSNFKSDRYCGRIVSSVMNSISGFRFLLTFEKAFQQEFVLFITTFLVAISFNLKNQFLMVFVAILVLVVESINTAIESICDEITIGFNQNIKIAKDVSSFAVFLLIILYFLIFLSALFDIYL